LAEKVFIILISSWERIQAYLRRFDRGLLPARAFTHRAPAKGAKFYSTSWRNANNQGLFEQKTGFCPTIIICIFINQLFPQITCTIGACADFNAEA
jgi:hypothetical protein